MGIGRREFLKFTSLALAGLIIDPYQAVITTENVYINKKLGILFHKPTGWGFVNVKDFGRIKDAQILDGQILDNGWYTSKEEIWEDLGDPICMVTKYYHDLPENKGIFSPTITLNITPRSELEDLGYETFEELIAMSEFGVSILLKEFKVINRYPPFEISGCKFYEYDAEYLFEHVDIDTPLKVELKVLKAEHNDFYYDFNCHQSKAQDQIASKEFEKFKKSIKLI